MRDWAIIATFGLLGTTGMACAQCRNSDFPNSNGTVPTPRAQSSHFLEIRSQLRFCIANRGGPLGVRSRVHRKIFGEEQPVPARWRRSNDEVVLG